MKMSITASGCGMGNVLKGDVENKFAQLPGVKEVHVEVVFDPPWHPASCQTRLSFSLASTWTTAQHTRPRYRSMEQESDCTQLVIAQCRVARRADMPDEVALCRAAKAIPSLAS
jgi:hypothetical protein